MLKILAIILTTSGHTAAVGEVGDGSWKVPFKTQQACNDAIAVNTVRLGLIFRSVTGDNVVVQMECLPADEADQRYQTLADKLHGTPA
jgi:hypothetical protein